MTTPSLLVLAAFGLFCQVAPAKDQEQQIGAIRALYGKIGKAKETKAETLKFELKDDPMEGTITRRSFEGGLMAIKLAHTLGDHDSTEQNFYYKDGKLFFIFVQDSSWEFAPGGTEENPKTKDTLRETRYFVQDGAVLRALRRSVSSTGDKNLGEQISKAENEEFKPPAGDGYLFKRAEALLGIETEDEAVKFFTNEVLPGM